MENKYDNLRSKINNLIGDLESFAYDIETINRETLKADIIVMLSKFGDIAKQFNKEIK